MPYESKDINKPFRYYTNGNKLDDQIDLVKKLI